MYPAVPDPIYSPSLSKLLDELTTEGLPTITGSTHREFNDMFMVHYKCC